MKSKKIISISTRLARLARLEEIYQPKPFKSAGARVFERLMDLVLTPTHFNAGAELFNQLVDYVLLFEKPHQQRERADLEPFHWQHLQAELARPEALSLLEATWEQACTDVHERVASPFLGMLEDAAGIHKEMNPNA